MQYLLGRRTRVLWGVWDGHHIKGFYGTHPGYNYCQSDVSLTINGRHVHRRWKWRFEVRQITPSICAHFDKDDTGAGSSNVISYVLEFQFFGQARLSKVPCTRGKKVEKCFLISYYTTLSQLASPLSLCRLYHIFHCQTVRSFWKKSLKFQKKYASLGETLRGLTTAADT